MSKYNKVTIAVLATSAMISGVAMAAEPPVVTTTVNGGTVHFKGEIVNAACAIDPGSLDQTVVLGQVRSAKFSAAGDTSDDVAFNIQLNDCDTTVAKNAAVSFSGVSVSGKNTVLALDSDPSGSAGNVGIEIIDHTGTPLTVDGSTFGAKSVLSDGTNVIPFHAHYISTDADVTPGTANASATFKVQYS